jgi:DNA repair ATPase RecN
VQIHRVQVEEGFLDGLDVRFASGLNVLIGERGTGKTSLIELIRFCLGVRGYTTDSYKRSLDHAVSVLGSGQVTVTLLEGESEVLITRSAADEDSRASGQFVPPVIFSQMEIENVGLQPSGRLRLLDGFVVGRSRLESQEQVAVSQAQSLTAEVEVMRRDLAEFEQQIAALPELENNYKTWLPRRKKLAQLSAEAASKKAALDAITKTSSSVVMTSAYVERFRQSLNRFRVTLNAAAQAIFAAEEWRSAAAPDPLANAKKNLEAAISSLRKSVQEVTAAESAASGSAKLVSDQKVGLDNQSRQLRTEIEGLQQGAGAVTRQVQQLRERKAQLESLKAVVVERKTSLAEVVRRRDAALEQLEKIREERFNQRDKIAKRLSRDLGPRLRIEVERAGQSETYASAIAEVLRGSGLKYGDLSTLLAERVSPRELLEAAEASDFEAIANATGVGKERAARVLAYVRESESLGTLATSLVEDNVSFQLLDGHDYKQLTDLSTGQRCTVVLPLILKHADRVLIIDQPEDHIDNVFIVDTLIKSILRRSTSSQLIVSTHNANIPVLGEAQLVIHLGSDGGRGYVEQSAPLDDPNIVKVISTLMEEGAEAFERRAKFYSKHR